MTGHQVFIGLITYVVVLVLVGLLFNFRELDKRDAALEERYRGLLEAIRALALERTSEEKGREEIHR